MLVQLQFGLFQCQRFEVGAPAGGGQQVVEAFSEAAAAVALLKGNDNLVALSPDLLDLGLRIDIEAFVEGSVGIVAQLGILEGAEGAALAEDAQPYPQAMQGLA